VHLVAADLLVTRPGIGTVVAELPEGRKIERTQLLGHEIEQLAVEAKKLGIPVIGVVDTNHSPDGIAYVIPGNDDSSRAIRLYARGIADAILEGRSQVVQEIIGAASDEFVEVEESGAKGQ